jgi:hypothetical protein
VQLKVRGACTYHHPSGFGERIVARVQIRIIGCSALHVVERGVEAQATKFGSRHGDVTGSCTRWLCTKVRGREDGFLNDFAHEYMKSLEVWFAEKQHVMSCLQHYFSPLGVLHRLEPS